MLNYLGSRSRQTLDSVPAISPICGQIGYKTVAEVAKTLDSVPVIHPICGQIGYKTVAEVAKTLDGTPVMHPICGQIGYQGGNTSNLWPDRLHLNSHLGLNQSTHLLLSRFML